MDILGTQPFVLHKEVECALFWRLFCSECIHKDTFRLLRELSSFRVSFIKGSHKEMAKQTIMMLMRQF